MNKEEIVKLEDLDSGLTVGKLIDMAKEIAKATVMQMYEEEAKKKKMNSPEKAAKRMLIEYRRLKKVATEEIQPTKEEAISLQWQYLKELMGNPDNKLYAENIAYITEKKLQYNQYKVQKIEKAMKLFEQECKESGSTEAMRGCRIIKDLYFTSPRLSIQEIAARENVVDKTIYKDIGNAYRVIAIYLSAM